MIKRTTPRKYRYWFEDEDEDFWYDDLDMRFVVPGLAMMGLSIPLIVLIPVGWIRLLLLVCFLASFIIVTKRNGRWY